MTLLLLLRSPASTYTWRYWNGTTETALTVAGVWDGTTTQPLGSTITVI